MQSRGKGSILITLLVLVGLAGLAWAFGFATALRVAPPPPAAPADLAAPPNFKLYSEVWRMVDHEFYGERPSPIEVTHNAIDGVVAALEDPYAIFLDSHELAGADHAEIENRLAPAFIEDLGIWVEPIAEGALVIAVLPEGASQGKLVAGDTIIGLVGEDEREVAGDETDGPLDGLALLDRLHKVEPGQARRLLVLHENDRGAAIEIAPRETESPVLEARRIDPDLAYLRLPRLDSDLLEPLDRALAAFAEGRPPAALILDLRDNPGGDPEAALRLAGRFIEGPVWSEVEPDGSAVERLAERDGADPRALPERLVVLVNGGTGGSAERLAAALRDRLGASLVGAATFGRGGIQSIVDLSDGSRLRLTVARWRSPGGTELGEEGLAVDVPVEAQADELAAGQDAQLETAIQAAREEGLARQVESVETGG